MTVTIYHNPACGTSRNTLAMIRATGTEPRVIEYLKTPPSRAELRDLVRRMGVTLRAILRQKGTPYDALGLADPALSDEALLDAIEQHPILINRPIVITPKGRQAMPPFRAGPGSAGQEAAVHLHQGGRRADRNRSGVMKNRLAACSHHPRLAAAAGLARPPIKPERRST